MEAPGKYSEKNAGVDKEKGESPEEKMSSRVWLKVSCPDIKEIDPSLPPAARSAARKTAGLKNILDKYKFKGVIAGIRRDEQGTRAKERIFSHRDESGKWDGKNQHTELWNQ